MNGEKPEVREPASKGWETLRIIATSAILAVLFTAAGWYVANLAFRFWGA